MSHALAVANEAVNPILTPDQSFEVSIGVEKEGDDDKIVTDPPYIPVPEGSVVQITWNINHLAVEHGVQFDTPAITFFGETPNILWLAPETNKRTAIWVNDNPGLSYSYRIHLLRRSLDNKYTPITDDPIVHNEPPPAP